MTTKAKLIKDIQNLLAKEKEVVFELGQKLAEFRKQFNSLLEFEIACRENFGIGVTTMKRYMNIVELVNDQPHLKPQISSLPVHAAEKSANRWRQIKRVFGKSAQPKHGGKMTLNDILDISPGRLEPEENRRRIRESDAGWVNIKIRISTHNRLKLYCVEHGIKMAELLNLLVEDYLKVMGAKSGRKRAA